VGRQVHGYVSDFGAQGTPIETDEGFDIELDGVTYPESDP
jgi:hypothetical protein